MAVKKFVKFDSEKGYIDNKDDINYHISNLMRKVAFGKMLGDFNENGLYVINSKIVEELIKMPKVIVEIIEGADLIRSKVKADSFFHFILTIEDNKAIFKLLEKIPYQSNRDFNSGAYSNINEYILDEVIIPDKDFNRNALYEKYNISIENDGEALSIFDMDELSIALYYNLVEKLKIDYLVQNALILKEKQLESIDADYFEAVLSVLAEYKEFGGKVKSSVKKDLAEKHNFVIISRPFFQKSVNEILDSYIDVYMQDLTVEQQEEFLTKLRAIKSQYYQRFKAVLPIEISQMAGVRFDPNQIIQEGIIGGLAQEITTKGFTSSDVRKILINEDELQLSISKIRQMVRENEEVCKRDNAKAQDITKDREQTEQFYKELEKEQEVDILKSENLIKSTIDEVSAGKENKDKKEDTKKKKEVDVSATSTKKPSANTKTTSNVKGGGNAPRTGDSDAKNSGKSQGGKPASSGTSTAQDKAEDKNKKLFDDVDIFIGKKKQEGSIKNEVLDDLVDIEVVSDKIRVDKDIHNADSGLTLQ